MSNKYTFNFTPLALKDIDNTFNYIANNLYNQEAVNSLMSKIENVIDNICLFPLSGAEVSSLFEIKLNYRQVPIANYILYYEVISESKEINIIRFLYGKSNVKNKIV